MSSPALVQKTVLHSWHQSAGARMIEFGGWDMPVQYSSILKEHAATRVAAGLFDISHMGEIWVKGPRAADFLNRTLTNDIRKISQGKGQYSLLLNQGGGVVDDLFVYQVAAEDYLLIVNAGHTEEDFKLLVSSQGDGVTLTDASDQMAAIALQGPLSPGILDAWIPGAASRLGHHAIAEFSITEGSCWIARTGYTGEDGFEIVCSNASAVSIWERLLKVGSPMGLIPCGLGARDTLRMEVCYPLNGHELGPDISPLEAGVGFFVDLAKPDFLGKASLVEQKANGIKRKSVALLTKPGGAPPRAGYPVLRDGRQIGMLTSGTMSPTLQTGIALALIETSEAVIGNSVDIEIRGKYVSATISKKPLYQKIP